MSPMPQQQLFEHLVQTGVIDSRGINDHPKARRCPGCHAPTIAAWRDGVHEAVHVDPVNLTRLGELQALTSGRRTFDHWGGAYGGLDQRRPDAITRWPAGDDAHPIRPEHRCGAPPLDAIPDRRYATYDQPPF